VSVSFELLESVEIPPAPDWPKYYAIGSHVIALRNTGRDGEWYVIVRLCHDGTREILLQSEKWELIWRSMVSIATSVTSHRRAAKAALN
jgi:hypothetical protein